MARQKFELGHDIAVNNQNGSNPQCDLTALDLNDKDLLSNTSAL